MHLTEDEEQVLEVLKKFADTEVKPLAMEIDRSKSVPQKIIDRMNELGLFASYIPQEYGGAGLSFTFLVRAIEIMSSACASTALVLDGAETLFAEPIMMFGSEDLKKRYLPQVASGAVGGLAITEPGAGSDAASIKTRAEKKGNKYVINGTKTFITNGRISKFFVFDAVTDPSKGYKGITTFVIDADTEGFHISRDIDKMGIRGSSTVELVFEDAEVPEANVIGKEGEGFKVIMETLDAGRVGIAAQAVGIAQSAIDEAIAYARDRKQFGKAITDFEGIQFMIADMSTQLEAARLLTYAAADAWETKKDSVRLSAMAKLFASDMAMKVTVDALQLFGGYGFTTDFSAERHVRDAKITQIYEGTNQIQKVIIAREVLKNL
ncbi:MAG: acyl-CoA dehydrogenase family protein [Candidatus Thermoplasmatota archaeon]|nr:acyl-CoA dehydrogenase family protein [Candidatus Thermoplasmatota archaeon]MCL5437809.1 acyl-CoA dehydrogenase family protein [Candidatus Thermoplasmatota archaeon]